MTEVQILLDRKTKALRSGDRWCVQRLLPDGSWDLVKAWNGGRRSIYHWMEAESVVPSREAEAALSRLPESTGFRDR